MRMNQDERRFDFHGLGLALKRAREEKGWTQAYVAELVDRDSRTIMNIENKGQYPSFDLFVKLITMFDISVDQFIHADGGARSSSCRKHIDKYVFYWHQEWLICCSLWIWNVAIYCIHKFHNFVSPFSVWIFKSFKS